MKQVIDLPRTVPATPGTARTGARRALAPRSSIRGERCESPYTWGGTKVSGEAGKARQGAEACTATSTGAAACAAASRTAGCGDTVREGTSPIGSSTSVTSRFARTSSDAGTTISPSARCNRVVGNVQEIAGIADID